MTQTLHPGVYTIEVSAQPKVTGVGVQTGGMVGLAQKGPDDKAILVTSFIHWETIFGPAFKHDTGSSKILSFTAFAVEAFFKSGGTSLYFVRHTSSAASKSTFNLFSVRRVNVYAATWTEVGLEITATVGTPFPATRLAGEQFVVVSGATAGTYAVDADDISNSTSVVVLAADPFSGGGNLTGIVGYLQTKILDIDSKYPGRWYSNLFIETEKARTSTTTVIPASGTDTNVLVVSSVSGFEAGDIIRIDPTAGTGTDELTDNDGDNGNVQYVYEVSSGATPTLLLSKGIECSSTGTITAATVTTASTHRKTIIGFLDGTVSVNSTSTYVDVTKGLSNNIVAGQHLLIMGNTTGLAVAAGASTTLAECDVIVSSIQTMSDRDRIVFAAAPTMRGQGGSIVGTFASTRAPKIISQEYTMNIYNNGVLLEQHAYLAMSSANERDYTGDATTAGRLSAGATNESNVVDVVTTESLDANELYYFGLTNKSEVMTAGADGAFDGAGTITIADNLALFDVAQEMSMLCCPDMVNNGETELNVKTGAKNLADYCSVKRPDVMAIIDPPLSTIKVSGSVVSPVQQIRSWRLSLPLDTTRAALYWPWFVVQNTTVSQASAASTAAFSQGGFSSPTLEIPPSGWQMGQFALVAGAIGPHQSPANIPHVGVLDVTYNASDADQDILNPISVNAIRFFSGSGGGIRTFGGRTLWSVTDGRHYVSVVRLLQFVEKSIIEGNRFAVFQPNDPSLWQRITVANEVFLTGLWQQGMLFPSNDVTKAFFVKCDAETNPPEERQAGRVNCLIGINAPFPAEFVVFRVGLFDGGSTVTELFGANAAGFFVS